MRANASRAGAPPGQPHTLHEPFFCLVSPVPLGLFLEVLSVGRVRQEECDDPGVGGESISASFHR